MRSAPPAKALSKCAPASFAEEWYLYATPDHFWMDWRLRMVMGQLRTLGLPLDKPLKVLDIGGGIGTLAAQIERRTSWTVDVADLNLAALEHAGARRGESFFYDLHDRHPRMLGSYDVVLLFDVIEHLTEPAAFVAAAVDHLKKGGALLLGVPALPWLFSGYDRAVGHHRRYTGKTLARELAGLTVDIRDVRYWGFSLVGIAILRKLVLALADEGKAVRTGFQPPFPLLNRLLRWMGAVETALIEHPPLGTSVALAALKR